MKIKSLNLRRGKLLYKANFVTEFEGDSTLQNILSVASQLARASSMPELRRQLGELRRNWFLAGYSKSLTRSFFVTSEPTTYGPGLSIVVKEGFQERLKAVSAICENKEETDHKLKNLQAQLSSALEIEETTETTEFKEVDVEFNLQVWKSLNYLTALAKYQIEEKAPVFAASDSVGNYVKSAQNNGMWQANIAKNGLEAAGLTQNQAVNKVLKRCLTDEQLKKSIMPFMNSLFERLCSGAFTISDDEKLELQAELNEALASKFADAPSRLRIKELVGEQVTIPNIFSEVEFQ